MRQSTKERPRKQTSRRYAPAPNEPAPVDIEYSVRHMQPSVSVVFEDFQTERSYDDDEDEARSRHSDSSSESQTEYEEEGLCDCDNCRLNMSRMNEFIRKDSGFTVAGAPSVRRARNQASDNGWTKFSNQ